MGIKVYVTALIDRWDSEYKCFSSMNKAKAYWKQLQATHNYSDIKTCQSEADEWLEATFINHEDDGREYGTKFLIEALVVDEGGGE